MRCISILFLALVFTIPSVAQTRLTPGAQAPAFASSSLDGGYYDLSAMHGSVVVLTFWSTKCEICRGEIPKLNNFAASYDENRVVFLALTMEHEDKVEAYLKGNPFKFHVLPDSFGVVLQYADRDKSGNIDMGFPSYFVIDQNGMLVYRANGWDKTNELSTRIGQLLASK